MKKISALILALAMLLGLAACGGEAAPEEVDINAKSEGVMTWAEYMAAESDSQVVIEAYVQMVYKDDDGNTTVLLADGDGGYCAVLSGATSEELEALTDGCKLKITGNKEDVDGEIEITGTAYEAEDGEYIPEIMDVTSLLGKDGLDDYQNMIVSFSGLTVENWPSYNWDGSGSSGDDIYIDLSDGTYTYTFKVESSMFGSETETYKAVNALQKGAAVSVEAVCWNYEGLLPLITSVNQ